jgi:hypothetical protein
VTSSGEDHGTNARLEALERDNRRLRRYGALLVVGMAMLLGLAVVLVYTRRSVTPEIAAQRFVLRDAGGNIRGAWGVAEDSSLRLVFQDQAGRPRIKVSLLNDGSAGISLADSGGNPRAVFALETTEGGSLVFADGTGRTRTVLGVSADGSANVVFADRNGATRAGLGVDTRGLGTFTLDEPGGRPPPAADSAPPDTGSTPAPSRRR